jgi:hypothetical protein
MCTAIAGVQQDIHKLTLTQLQAHRNYKPSEVQYTGTTIAHYRCTQTTGVYTVPKTRQISKSIGEEVPWRENLPVVLGN